MITSIDALDENSINKIPSHLLVSCKLADGLLHLQNFVHGKGWYML